MSGDKKASAQEMRLMDMVELLAGQTLRGMSNKDLSEAMQVPPSYVTRTADALISKGWARRDEVTGRIHITTRFSRIAFRVTSDFERAEQSLAELKRNFTLPS